MTVLPTALSDLGEVAPTLAGLVRIETHPRPIATPLVLDKLRSVYPHDQIYGEFCPVQGYVDAPPREVFDWLSHTRSLEEWSYSLRGFAETDEPGLWVAQDRLGADTEIYVRTIASPDAMTVDYHCAWDQGRHLWMIYLMRVVDAQVVLNKPGSVVLWVNCHHPFYDENPFPETAPPERPVWVGDFWDTFAPGHQIELDNLTAIAEYRHRNGLPLTPEWMRS
ncbi:SRPBCC family protein [Gordonia rubripertincta]|uniref:SRPBCC family protein n=1 Tax=Gordonia rubripertincta TaxID=36822 RepID=A0AAW4GAV9_GORRU|nr:SRPBCC family protein [Gordonia rubripertincta]MBM7280270.1 SRPBCC family protein [Gordonia rubripertincta]